MRILCLLPLIAASPALAEVKSSGPTGFEVERKAVVSASPSDVYAQIGRIGEWWDPAHSYSGKSQNIRLELKAGGCFCETLDNGGGIQHLEVVYADPGTGIRMQGGLGPLQLEAVAGTFSWMFKAVPGGTEVTQNYLVSGTARGGLDNFAAPVDKVLGEQFDRLVARFAR